MNEVMFSRNSNEWATPQEFFDALYDMVVKLKDEEVI
jgi:hypothetical protein